MGGTRQSAARRRTAPARAPSPRTLYVNAAARDPVATALARAGWTLHRASLPAAELSSAAAQRAATRSVAEAQRALGGLDVVVLAPRLPSRRGTGRRPPTLAAWQAGLDGPLRGTWMVGRAAALALAGQGSGSLIVVIEPAADAVAVVAAEALCALVDGLRKAVPPAVSVVAVDLTGGRADAAATAAAIRCAASQTGARRLATRLGAGRTRG